ncbi:MAG: YgaP family membrane protein [Magnetospiraceae bacterium]
MAGWKGNLDDNMGIIDRALRMVVGLILISLAFFGPKTWFGLVGLIPLVTAFVGFCPLYKMIGLSTLKAENPES